MKRILLVMPYFYPHKGGSQKYAEELYVHLLKNNPNSFQVDVLCYNTDRAPQFETYRGLNIYRVPCWQLIPARFALPNPLYLIKTLLRLAKNKYHFVNSQLVFFDPCWWVWAYARLIGAKSIFTEHVATYPVHQSRIVEILSRLVDKTIGRFSVNRYDLITATNKAAINFLRRELNIKKDIKLVYGGVDTTYFSPSTTSDRIIPLINKTLNINDLLITFVGRIIWTKGVTLLFQAIKEIIDQIPPNVYFLFVGGGELEQQLRADIQKHGLSQRIFITGFVPYSQVRDTLRITDIFINPSHHNEGFPNTILEAGACQNFVIATDNAGTKEVINNLKTGLLIPQRDLAAIKKSLLWTLSNPSKRQKIAKNMRHLMVTKFDWNTITKDFAKLLSHF